MTIHAETVLLAILGICVMAGVLVLSPLAAHGAGDVVIRTLDAGGTNGAGYTPFPGHAVPEGIYVPNGAYGGYANNSGLRINQYGQMIATSDFYKTFDTNHDGIISASEYLRGLNRNHMPHPDGGILAPHGNSLDTTGSTVILPGRP